MEQKQLKSYSPTIFSRDAALGVSKFRFHLLRIFYVLIIFLLGIEVWMKILSHNTQWEPLPAVAFSFWAAFSLLAILGVINPLKMIPLLLVQFTYKLIWLIIVAWPLWSTNALTGSNAQELAFANFTGIIIDILVIPWQFVIKNFILRKKAIDDK